MPTKFPYKIVTLGSHSALQILHGAKIEGFSTIVLCKKDMVKTYTLFNVADEIITIDSYDELVNLQDMLIKKKSIIIPHASFITYIGYEVVEKLKIPYFGNKKILRWESDRDLERKWLRQSGLRLP
ncbi:MAG: DUF1246 domain-containing protein, partial [Nanoarchaeota archaeon]